MKQHFVVLSICVVCLTLTGCAAAVHSPVTGLLVTNVKGPLTATGKSGTALKSGSSEATSVLGLVASGDASIRAAALAGGITEIHYVDYHSASFLGIYAKFTTTVYGTRADVSLLSTERQEIARQRRVDRPIRRQSAQSIEKEKVVAGVIVSGVILAFVYMVVVR